MLEILGFLLQFILIAIFLIAFFQAFVTHTIFVYEQRIAQVMGEIKETIQPTTLIKSFLIEWLCNVVILLSMPLAHLRYQPAPHTQTEHAPILLIHGYLHNQADWLLFRRTLAHNPDLGPIYSLNLPQPVGSIVENALALREKIATIKQETGKDSLILIGHSMGGLVASYYCEYLAEKGEIEKLVTLASPFRGTKLSVFGVGKNCAEMSPNSQFLGDLLTRLRETQVPYYFVASKLDNVVIPWIAGFPPHISLEDDNILILEDHGHHRILFSAQVAKKVAEWLVK